MKRILIGLAALSALLLMPLVAHAQTVVLIEIPEGPPPSLDGVNSPGEWDNAVDLPLAALPLRAMALHHGGVVYLVFETTSPSEEWESFAVLDNGDGDFYNAGDKMVLCSSDGCKSCEYTAQYDFTCSEEDLPGAVEDGTAEVLVHAEMLVGQVVFGVIINGAEHIADSFFDISLADAEPTGIPATQISQPVIEPTDLPPTQISRPEIEPIATPPPQISPWGYIGIGLGAALVLAGLVFFLWKLVDWLKIKQKEREVRAGKAARAVKGAGRRAEKGAKKAAKEQAKKDQTAKKAGAAAKKASDAISQDVLDDAANAASDGERALAGKKPLNPSNKKYKKSKSTAMKNDLKRKAKNLHTLAKQAEKAAKAADEAARGASPDLKKRTEENAKAARNAANTAMTIAKQVWKVVQKISPFEKPPW